MLLGAKHAGTVNGIELHGPTYRRFQRAMQPFHTPGRQLTHGDFFVLLPKLGRYHVILTNPPYIRHHSIPPRGRLRMQAALESASVAINGKASAWAYFVLSSTQLLVDGGRLAAVLPTELLTSDYGKGVMTHLRERFSRVRLVRCDRTVFPELSQRVLLCLADGLKKPNGKLAECLFDSLQSQASGQTGHFGVTDGMLLAERLDTPARLTAGSDLIVLERSIAAAPGVRRLGDVCKPSIGYVTGDNDFFHLTASDIEKETLNKKNLVPALARAKDVQGIVFDHANWRSLQDQERPCWLFRPPSTADKAVRRLIARGKRHGVADGAKCSSRKSWWRVPLGSVPPWFLVYMGPHVRIVRNAAKVQVSNSFYALRPLRDTSTNSLAVASLTSAFRISVMLESRELGGGLRKLEPSDAARLLVPACDIDVLDVRQVEHLVEAGDWQSARLAADDLLLRRRLHWPSDLIASLQRACLDQARAQ